MDLLAMSLECSEMEISYINDITYPIIRTFLSQVIL